MRKKSVSHVVRCGVTHYWKYMAEVMVPVVQIMLTQFPECGFEVFVEYPQFPIALWVVWSGENTVNAMLLEYIIHKLNSLPLFDSMYLRHM